MSSPIKTSRTIIVGRNRRGFSLLEVIVAVALSVFIVAGIAAAIRLNALTLTRQRINIERSQIARNVLVMVKNDLRAAIQYKPADVTGIEDLQVDQAALAQIAAGADPSSLAGAGGGDLSGLAEGAGLDAGMIDGLDVGAGGGAMDSAGGSDTSTPQSTVNQNISGGQSAPARPGLYGNSTEIMVDISRLPRVDQYNPLVAGGNNQAVSIPSDIKTISYFVSDESLDLSNPQLGLDRGALGGLYRRELDRAVAAFSYDIAGTMAAVANTRLIAPEVVQIQFQYWDGQAWQAEWDSDLQGGFPAAIEIAVIVDNNRTSASRELENESRSQVGSVQFDPETMQLYRTVVNLPIAEMLSQEELDAISGAGAADAAASSGETGDEGAAEGDTGR